MPFDISILVVAGFLIINLVLGLSFGRKVKNIQDYALGGRNFSTATLVSTIVATWIGGDYLFITLAEVYASGLLYAVGCLGMAAQLLLVSYVFVPRMDKFLGSLSIAEAMGNLYGKHVRIISAICGSIASAGFIAVQFKVFGSAFSFFMDIEVQNGIYLASAITILYSAFGGIRSVTATDVVQFFTFGVMIPVIGIIVWNDVHNAVDFNLVNTESVQIFNYKEFLGFSNPRFWELFMLFVLFCIPGFEPSVFQRISIGRDIKQVKLAFRISALLIFFILISMSWISFLLFNIDQSLDPDNLVHYIVNNYAYGGLKSFIILGIVAMCMSTADSEINSSTVLLTHDLFVPLKGNINNELILSKLLAIFIGIGSIVLALSDKNMLELVFMTQSFYAPIVGIPFMSSILGFKTKTKSVLVGMIAGAITVIIWRIYFKEDTGIDGLVPGMAANFLFLQLSHYFFKEDGGWGDPNNKKFGNGFSVAKIYCSLVAIFKTVSFVKFCKNNSPKNELTYTGFGVFSTISTICSMYAVSSTLGPKISKDLIWLYELMLIVSISFITFPIWPSTIKRYKLVQLSWNVAILLLLVFCSSFFVILTNFAPLQFVVFTINIISVAILTRWEMFLGMLIVGVLSSSQFYMLYANVESIDFNVNSTVLVLYTLLLIGATLIVFLKPKQENLEEAEKRVTYLESEMNAARNQFDTVKGSIQKLEKQFEEKEGTLKEKEKFLLDQLRIRKEEVSKLSSLKDEFIRNVMHESNTPMTSILTLSDILYTYYDKLDKAEIKQSIKDIIKGGERLKTYISSITDLSKLSSLSYKLKYEDVNLSNLVKERPYLYKKIFSEESERQSFVFDVQENIMIRCDKYYMTQALDNLISNAVKYGKGNPVKISLHIGDNGIITFEIRDQGIGIPTNELIKIFDKFTVSSKTATPAEGRGIGLALVDKIIKTHGGKVWAESDGKSWSVFRFTL